MATKKEKKEGAILHKIILLIYILAFLSSILAIYEIFLFNGIETLIRYIIMGLLFLYDIRLFLKVRKISKGKVRKNNKKYHKKLFLFWLLLYSIICLAIAYSLNFVYSKVSSANKTTITYTSYLVVLSENKISDIKNAKDMKIALLNDKKNPDGYIIPKEMIKKYDLEDDNEIIEYDDYTSMLADLYAREIEGMFVPSEYVSMFSGTTGYENIETNTKIIGEASKTMKKAAVSTVETASSGKSVTEPFTILLMGIDSTDEVLTKNAIANGDTLILITFNPKTLNATMLSIPRDSYVPISCWSGHPENKITHAAAYGNDCMIRTIENYFDTSIDYYAKINFKGLVKLVDSLGGVEVDVEQELCTDDSNRTGVVCIHPGLQTLNGEQALVYARNRKQLANGDFGRNYHQQVIVMALMNKVKEIKDATQFMDLLNTVSNSVDTNFTTKQILSFYNVAKDIIKKSMSSEEADIINIERLYLSGSSQMIYDERARMVLYEYVPNQNSRKDIIEAMKVNLGLLDHTDIKEFTFSINKTYEKEVIGYGPYKSTGTFSLIPDFTGDSKEAANATCSRIGLKCTFVGTSGYVVSQSHPASSRVDKAKNFTLTLSQNKKDTDDKDKKDKDKDKKDTKDTEDTDDDEKDTTDDNKENNSSNSNNNTENNENNNTGDNGSSNENTTPDE